MCSSQGGADHRPILSAEIVPVDEHIQQVANFFHHADSTLIVNLKNGVQHGLGEERVSRCRHQPLFQRHHASRLLKDTATNVRPGSQSTTAVAGILAGLTVPPPASRVERVGAAGPLFDVFKRCFIDRRAAKIKIVTVPGMVERAAPLITVGVIIFAIFNLKLPGVRVIQPDHLDVTVQQGIDIGMRFHCGKGRTAAQILKRVGPGIQPEDLAQVIIGFKRNGSTRCAAQINREAVRFLVVERCQQALAAGSLFHLLFRSWRGAGFADAQAAVDRQNDTVDVAGQVRGQEDNRVSEVFRLAQTPAGDVTFNCSQRLSAGEPACQGRRVDQARRNTVHPDAERNQIDRHGAGH